MEVSSADGEVFWERDGEPLDESTNVHTESKGRTHFLHINNMQSDDEGDFEVFFEFGEDEGEEISSMCEVYINDAPPDDQQPQSVAMQQQQQQTVAMQQHQQQQMVAMELPSSDGVVSTSDGKPSEGLFAVEEKLKPVVVESGETTSFLVVLTRAASTYKWLVNDKQISEGGKFAMQQNDDHYTLTINNCDVSLDKKSVQFIGYVLFICCQFASVGASLMKPSAFLTIIDTMRIIQCLHQSFFYSIFLPQIL